MKQSHERSEQRESNSIPGPHFPTGQLQVLCQQLLSSFRFDVAIGDVVFSRLVEVTLGLDEVDERVAVQYFGRHGDCGEQSPAQREQCVAEHAATSASSPCTRSGGCPARSMQCTPVDLDMI